MKIEGYMKRSSEEYKSRVLDMQKWADNIKTVEDERIRLAIITANNHYAGFGPRTVNIFRNMIGLPEATIKERVEGEEQYSAQDSKQSTLTDFLS
jgi:hypothetical protein